MLIYPPTRSGIVRNKEGIRLSLFSMARYSSRKLFKQKLRTSFHGDGAMAAEKKKKYYYYKKKEKKAKEIKKK